jgi:hypothetical protein
VRHCRVVWTDYLGYKTISFAQELGNSEEVVNVSLFLTGNLNYPCNDAWSSEPQRIEHSPKSRSPGNTTSRTNAATPSQTRDGNSEMDLGLEDSICMAGLEDSG